MAAKFGEAQADQAAEAAELKAVTEVRQAYARYNLARAAVSQYSGELLQDADTVLEAKLYSYRRGGASLLEVLDAQRANNDAYLAYLGRAGRGSIGQSLSRSLCAPLLSEPP